MKLLFFFCLPVCRFNSLKKRFVIFKKRVSRSSKYSRFFDRTSAQTQFLIFVNLVLLDGVPYRLYLLNAKFHLIMLFFTSLSKKGLFDFVGFTSSLKVKMLTAVVSVLARLSVNLSTSVLNVTVPDNALGSLGISLFDTHFEEMALLPVFDENEWIGILLYPIGHKLHNDL